MMTISAQGTDEAAPLWPALLRRAAFRRTFAFASVLAVSMCLLAVFVSWQTIRFLQGEIDTHLLTDARSIAQEPDKQVFAHLRLALSADLEQKRVGGVFDGAGKALAGNLTTLPQPLPRAETVGPVGDPLDAAPGGKGVIRIAYVPLRDGHFLVFGRRVNELNEVDAILTRTIAIAIVPILCVALLGGLVLSRLVVVRVRRIEEICRQIVAGDFERRLPVDRRKNEATAIAVMLNHMLDEIERLMLELKCAGDALAHDLRTPLTRIRARLGRTSEGISDRTAAASDIEQTLVDVDRLIDMTRAILRLGEIEDGHRRRSFKEVEVAGLLESIGEFYSLVAEEKRITFVVSAEGPAFTIGDGELLFEAIGNLVDNAVKFTPVAGRVELHLIRSCETLIVRIEDSGPGIPADERQAVLRRFYRSDPARRVPGTGLGLPIAAAVVRLHGYRLHLDAPPGGFGCRADIIIPSMGDGASDLALPNRMRQSI